MVGHELGLFKVTFLSFNLIEIQRFDLNLDL